MKQIIIILLIVILGIMGFNMYSKYKRFSLQEYEYKVPEGLDVSKADKGLVYDYYNAIEAVNGYIITQWSANKIDVRNPKNDRESTLAAVNQYREKLAKVAYYEAMITQPKTTKEAKKLSKEDYKKQLIRKQFYANPEANQLSIGDQNALVYEVQRMLNAHGDSLELDGLYRAETFNALLEFEQKNGLFADGKLDAITLEYLLN